MDSSLDFSESRITVMGLGVFGGGAGVTRFLVSRGARVTVTDLRPEEELAEGLAEIEDLPVEKVFGEHRETDFRDTDMVIANPAVPMDSAYLRMAEEAGVPVESEMSLTLRLLPSRRVVGVTGSNGKTTTSHLVHHLLKAAGENSWLGGNMGGSLLDKVDSIKSNDPVVLELSSFQLERCGPLGLGPDIGVITNLTPNHLDRHGDFDTYVDAKAWIFTCAMAAVINAEDETSMRRFGNLDLPTLRFSSESPVDEGYFLNDGAIFERRAGSESCLMSTEDVRLPGVFNLENLMAALAASAWVRNSDPLPKAALAAGASFKGVPHRLERVASKDGVVYINDSIATTPESCCAALNALEGEIHLIAGGYDKELPLDDFAGVIAQRAFSVYLIGATGPMLEKAIIHAIQGSNAAVCGPGNVRDSGLDRVSGKGIQGSGENVPHIEMAGTLERAVRRAAEKAKPGATVLLSPGFASYDQFRNFVERGDCFRRSVAGL